MGQKFGIKLGLRHLFFQRAHARQHPHDAGKITHFLKLFELCQKVVQVKLTLAQLLGHFLGVFGLDVFGSLFNQADNIAHAKNTVGDTIRMEGFHLVDFFADTDHLDRAAGDLTHRKGGTTARITINTGQNDTGDADLVGKFLGNVDRVLTGHRIGNQKGLDRVDGITDLGDFAHQFHVDMQTTGGIKNDRVIAFLAAGIHRTFGNRNRFLAHDDRQNAKTVIVGQHFQLLLGGRTIDIKRCQKDFLVALFGQVQRDLGGTGGFTRTLQTDHQDRNRRGGSEIDFLAFTQHVFQFVMDDLDDHLARRDRAQNIGTNCTFGGVGDKGFNDRKCDVRLKQGDAYFAHGLLDVGFFQRATFAQLIENPAKAIA